MNGLWKSPESVNINNAPILEIPETGDSELGYHIDAAGKDVTDMMEQLDIRGIRTI